MERVVYQTSKYIITIFSKRHMHTTFEMHHENGTYRVDVASVLYIRNGKRPN